MIEDEIVSICNGIIDDCDKRIKRDYQSADSNRVICSSALELFATKVSPKFGIVIRHSKQPTQVKRVKEYLSEFYYSLAIFFTWGDDYVVANQLLKKARSLVSVGSSQRVKIDELIGKIKPYLVTF